MEWKAGIGRLLGPGALPIPEELAQLLQPYLDAVRALNPPGELSIYPGSPGIARALLRAQDRLVLNELHRDDAAVLRTTFARDDRTKVLNLDGWTALKSLLPPKERRGVVLIDPPFELRNEFDLLAAGLAAAHRRFATGTFIAWYPIKDPAACRRFHRELVEAGYAKLLKAEFLVRRPVDLDRLNGSGLIILNPPYLFDRELSKLLQGLSQLLAEEQETGTSVLWLDSERIRKS